MWVIKILFDYGVHPSVWSGPFDASTTTLNLKDLMTDTVALDFKLGDFDVDDDVLIHNLSISGSIELERGHLYELNLTAYAVNCAGESTVGSVDTHFLQPVPEPTTMLLFGTGLAGLAILSRRRKK